jgi:4-hydroxy-tetrahydrodipicolinate synthase
MSHPLTSLSGLIPATITPFTADGALDEVSLRRYLEWLGTFDLGGVVMHADSGEVHTLSPGERERVTTIAVEVLGGRIPVIAGLATQSTAEAVEAGLRLREAGADALMVFPPLAFLGSPLPAELPEKYYRVIADQVGLPLVAFQLLAALGGVEYSPDALRRILAIEQVVAIKEASFDAMKYRATLSLVRSLPRPLSLLTGNDPFVYESLLMGADGALIGFGSLAPGLQVELCRAVTERDYERAESLTRALQPLNEAAFAAPVRDYRGRVKAALAAQDIIGSAAVRAPLQMPPAHDVEAVVQALRTAESTGLVPAS